MSTDRVLHWYDWFLSNTESFEGELGSQLAYLWPAMLRNSYVEVWAESSLVRLLRSNDVPADADIWQHIVIEKDDGDLD